MTIIIDTTPFRCSYGVSPASVGGFGEWEFRISAEDAEEDDAKAICIMGQYNDALRRAVVMAARGGFDTVTVVS